MKTGVKVFLGLGCGGAVFLGAILMGALVFIGIKGPETRIVLGHEMSAGHMKVINELDLLKGTEKILFFYSDGLIDIKDGMYMLTDQNVILYTDTWEQPLERIPFHQIAAVEFHRDASFFTDSSVYLDLFNDDRYWFQLSSENGTDVLFIERLNEFRKAAGIIDEEED